MLSAHITDDQGRSDTEEPAEIRWNMGTLPNVADTAQFLMEELCGSVKRMTGWKYLGPEMNDVEDFQRAMDGLHQEILKLVSGYLYWGIFTRKWQVETSSPFEKNRNETEVARSLTGQTACSPWWVNYWRDKWRPEYQPSSIISS
jgi:hypothetical protein